MPLSKAILIFQGHTRFDEISLKNKYKATKKNIDITNI